VFASFVDLVALPDQNEEVLQIFEVPDFGVFEK